VAKRGLYSLHVIGKSVRGRSKRKRKWGWNWDWGDPAISVGHCLGGWHKPLATSSYSTVPWLPLHCEKLFKNKENF